MRRVWRIVRTWRLMTKRSIDGGWFSRIMGEGEMIEKYLQHDKRWIVYMNEKRSLIKGWYYVKCQVLTGKRCFG